MLRQAGSIGEQENAGLDPAREGGDIAAHRIDVVDDDAGMVEQAFARRGRLDAAAATLQEDDAKCLFQPLDPRACRGEREIAAECTARDAACIGDRDEELEIDQIETHGDFRLCQPSSCPKACSVTSRLRRPRRSVNVVA